jgi:glycosyltransferase involved in cell wall biosynthesis
MVVHHFGPDPATVGGIASVLRLLSDLDIGGDVVRTYPTWRPSSSPVDLRLAANAALRLLRIPTTERRHIAHFHVSERGSFLREGALATLARHRGLTTVVTIHGAEFPPFARAHRHLVSSVLGHAHAVVCLDGEALEIVRRAVPGLDARIVPNPIATQNDSAPADQTEELVVFAGEIGHRKGADVLWRAWRLVAQRRPRARCLMVGPSTDYEPPSVERLEVRRPATHADVLELLRRARVVALPARAEAMPMILAEAMSFGRPFVSTPVGGVPDMGDGGVLVPVNDHMALAERLIELLADPQLARALGERGRRFCQQTRSVEIVDEQLRSLYSQLTGSGSARRSRRVAVSP